MAFTLTKTSGPSALGPGMKVATYEVLWDSSYPTGGEAIDLTNEFTTVSAILPGGNDTSADNAYICQPLLPAYGTAATSSNTLLQMFWDPADGGAAEVLVEVTNGTDLSDIGATKIVVFGK